jgi:hypothetical protein
MGAGPHRPRAGADAGRGGAARDTAEGLLVCFASNRLTARVLDRRAGPIRRGRWGEARAADPIAADDVKELGVDTLVSMRTGARSEAEVSGFQPASRPTSETSRGSLRCGRRPAGSGAKPADTTLCSRSSSFSSLIAGPIRDRAPRVGRRVDGLPAAGPRAGGAGSRRRGRPPHRAPRARSAGSAGHLRAAHAGPRSRGRR